MKIVFLHRFSLGISVNSLQYFWILYDMKSDLLKQDFFKNWVLDFQIQQISIQFITKQHKNGVLPCEKIKVVSFPRASSTKAVWPRARFGWILSIVCTRKALAYTSLLWLFILTKLRTVHPLHVPNPIYGMHSNRKIYPSYGILYIGFLNLFSRERGKNFALKIWHSNGLDF